MTRKDFTLIALALHSARPTDETTPQYEGWSATVNAVARDLAAANPRFNVHTFHTACSHGAD